MAEQLLDSVRRTICKMYGEGERCVDIAEKLGIRYRTVVSVIALYRGTSRVVSLRRGAPKRKTGDEGMMGFIKTMFYDGVSLRQMQTRVLAAYGTRVSVTTLQRATKCFCSGIEKGLVGSDSVVNERAINEPSVVKSVIVEPGVVVFEKDSCSTDGLFTCRPEARELANGDDGCSAGMEENE